MDKLIAVFPDKELIRRWDLRTWKSEATSVLPRGLGLVRGIAMGSASNGPLVLCRRTNDGRRSSVVFLDALSFKTLPVELNSAGASLRGGTTRASADGHVFTSATNKGNIVWRFIGNDIEKHPLGSYVEYVVPGPHGRFLYTARGIYTSGCKRIDRLSGDSRNYPALHGPYFLSVKLSGRRPTGLSVRLVSNRRMFAELSNIQFGYEMERGDYGGFSADRRLFFVPRAKLIITIPRTSDRFILHRFDPEQALQKSNLNYLVVTSDPLRRAVRGQSYSYQMTVHARKLPVKYELESGPPGIKVSVAGKVEWAVPADFGDSSSNVIVAIRDADGQEAFQTWTIGIAGK